jgi:uncharacterized protein YecE (DUF72 family)
VIVVATAGWPIPRATKASFPGTGTHLHRYSRLLRGVEINTSFYRDHPPGSYRGWAAQTPRNFAFSAKLPRQITHDQRLRSARRPLEAFLQAASALGRRLGPLLVQLPPSLPFERRVARSFFTLLRDVHAGPVVCEPRHASWFEAGVDALLQSHHIGRVAADPPVVPAAAEPGGWPGIVYYRLHGSPRKYWSVYDAKYLAGLAAALKRVPRGTPAWCVFDNTASGGAMANALQLRSMLSPGAGSSAGSPR